MATMQKHERETLKLLREHGFAAELKRCSKGHSDLFVMREGAVKRLKLASSPARPAGYAIAVLRRCEKLFKESP